MLLEKKVALVTGASSFLGTAIVDKLLDKFVVLKTGTKPLDEPNYFQADLTKDDHAENLIAWALNKTRKVDCLICCAGGNSHNGIRPKVDDAYRIDSIDVLTIFNRNVMTAINCCRHLVPHMLNRKTGHICFIGSYVVGHPRDKGHLTSYGISKAALHEYTVHLANQLRRSGIYVNCVAPTTVSSHSDVYPMPIDVARAVEYFCTVSGVTGQVLSVVK